MLVDLSDNRLTMLDGRFYYTDEKEPKPIPSVTTILNAYPKDAGFYEWLKKNGEDSDEIFNEAGRRGSRIHDLTERYDKGEKISLIDENGKLSMNMIEWAQFERYTDFCKRFNPTWGIIEQNVVSTKLNAAGTVDRVGVIPFMGNGNLIIDIKTSPSLYDSYWVQLAAYKEMMIDVMKIKIDGYAVLHLNAKIRTENPKECQGIGWRLYTPPKEHSYYWDLFQATQKLWYAQNGNLVPKLTQYSLTHQKEKSVKNKPVKK